MKPATILLAAALLNTIAVAEAVAECQIADAKLEEAISRNPQLHGPANRQAVRDLRSLRDAAFTLRSYGRHDDCERLLANIRELIAGPHMATLGGNDEEEATKQMEAREPKVPQGAAQGHRGDKNVKPLIRIDELSPALRADEIIGAEVRSSTIKSSVRSETLYLERRIAEITPSLPQAASSLRGKTALSCRSNLSRFRKRVRAFSFLYRRRI